MRLADGQTHGQTDGQTFRSWLRPRCIQWGVVKKLEQNSTNRKNRRNISRVCESSWSLFIVLYILSRPIITLPDDSRDSGGLPGFTAELSFCRPDTNLSIGRWACTIDSISVTWSHRCGMKMTHGIQRRCNMDLQRPSSDWIFHLFWNRRWVGVAGPEF